MPLISIILPAYNGEKTVLETVESVLNQTWSDWELIAIDDGSQDSTVEILSSIRDPRVKVFSYPNTGPSASRNRGITHARGNYISFIDADDLWTPDKLESQLKALQENPQAALAYSWTNMIDESSQFLRIGSHITVNGNAYSHLLVLNFLENGSNPLIRQQTLTEVGLFDESLTHGEDWDLWLRLAARYDFVAVPYAQILYRVSSNSASANVCKQEAGMREVIERAFEVTSESLQYLKQYSLGNTYKYLAFKTLEDFPGREKCLMGGRLIWQAIRIDRSLLRRRVIWKVWLKIAIVFLLPPQIARLLLFKVTQLSNLEALLAHMIREPPTKLNS